MTTNLLNPTVQEDLQKVHDTLHDIKCLAKLHNVLHHPRNMHKLRDGSYDNLNEFNLLEVGQALVSVLNLEKLFPLVNDLAVYGTGSSSGIIVLANGEEVQLKASKGLLNNAEDGTVFKVGDGPIGWVVKHGKPIVVDDIEKDQRFDKQQVQWYLGKTSFCVPIKIEGKVAGVISVNNKKSGDAYTENDKKFLETIAAYTSIAIRNSDLYEKLKNPNKLDQLTTSYYDESNKYIPVTLRSIKMGPFSGCDLYLQTIVNSEIKYLLYCKGSKLFDDERKESFVKKNINKIYVSKNGNAQYLRYIEMNLEQIVRDEMIALFERSKIIYDVATNLMFDVVKGSNITAEIERAKDWTTIVLDFILRDKEVCSHLMRILTYDGNVSRHSVNVAVMGLLFGCHLGLSVNDLSTLGIGLLLHDIGKTGIDYSTIRKNIEDLTKEEKEQIRKHPELGYILLSNSDNLPQDVSMLVRNHHENYNGKGYPDGLKGEEIHYFCRIGRILDEYETRISKSAANDGNPTFQVLQLMVKWMDGSFDKVILKKFIDFLHINTNEASTRVQQGMVEVAR